MRLTLVTLVLVGLVIGALPAADAFADGTLSRARHRRRDQGAVGRRRRARLLDPQCAGDRARTGRELPRRGGGSDRRPRRVHRRREPAEQLDSLHVAQPAQLHHLPARLRLLPEALRDHAAPAPDRIRGLAEDHGEATRRLRAAPADDAGRPALRSSTSQSTSRSPETGSEFHSLAQRGAHDILVYLPSYGEKSEVDAR